MSSVSSSASDFKIPSSSNMCNQVFNTFSLVPMSKSPTGEWSKDNDTKKFINKHKWRSESISDLILSPSCRGVPCGRINNCIVIDLDFYDKLYPDGSIKTKFNLDNDFINTFGNIDKCIELFKDTLIIKTARGGLHLYYQYDKSIKTTSNSQYQIDIRSDGGYVVAGGSVLADDTSYSVVSNSPISKIPEDLRKWLITNLWSSKKVLKPIKNDGDFEVYDQDEVDLTAYNYDIDEEIMDDILEHLPLDYFTDNTKWLIFSTAMKQTGHKDLWEIYSEDKGGDTFNYERNQSKWNYLKHKSLMCLEHILDASSIVEDPKLFLGYVKYKPTSNNTIEPTIKLDSRRYLDTDNDGKFITDIHKRGKAMIIKSDTGTGKTTAFKNFVKRSDKPFISIVSRITLGEEQVRIFRKEGIKCYFHQEITDRIKTKVLKDGEPAGEGGCNGTKAGFYEYEGENIVITIDSIMKIGGWGPNDDTPEEFKYNPFEGYSVYLDELNSLIEYFLDCPNLSYKRLVVYKFLIKVLQGAEIVIGTDADISDVALNFFSGNNLPYQYISNEYKHNKGIEASELFSYKSLVDEVSKEDKYMVACDEKGTAIKLGDDLTSLGHENVLVISADSPMDILKDLNLDDHDKVIFSPKIVYGLDSIMERKVFGYFRCRTIDPRGMIQQIARCRNIVSLQFLFEDKNWKAFKYDSVEDCQSNLLQGIKIFNNSFAMCDLIEDQETFNSLYSQYVYNQDCFKSNYFAHFLNLLRVRGFDLEIDHTIMKHSSGQTGSIVKEISEKKETIVLDEFEKFIEVYTKHEAEKVDIYQKYCDLIMSVDDPRLSGEVEDYADKYNIKARIGHDNPAKYCEYIMKDDTGDLGDELVLMKRELVKEYFSKPFADVINLLNLKPDMIEGCKEIITDPRILARYYNMKRYFFDPNVFIEDPLDKVLAKSKDFDIKKMTSINNQIIFLKKLKDAVGIHERTDLKMTKEIAPDIAHKLWLEYTSIRRVRTKENHFLYPAGVKKQIIVMYKDLFGVDIIDTKRTTKKNEKTGKLDKVVKYDLNEEYYYNMKKIFINFGGDDYKF
mgnify:CR=1 FL=1